MTWGNGSTGIAGPVTPENSLIGGMTNDRVGTRMIAMSDGNYVVISEGWSLPDAVAGNTNEASVVLSVGAVTFGNGRHGITGLVMLTNSAVGAKFASGVYITAAASGKTGLILTGILAEDRVVVMRVPESVEESKIFLPRISK